MTPGDVTAQLFDDFTNAPSVYDDFWELPEHDDDDLLISHQTKKQKTFFLSSDDEHPEHSLSGPSHQPPPLSREWRWEGTIAKKGIPICRACCFPVGIVTDIKLPEVLNIVARTGLETVAEQYYQAAGAWVVFFAPESEADIGLYNDFIHGLEGKQRAAVAELDEETALFLVPPSEFSEKVLKVPGTSRISGVIIRFGHRGTDAGPSSLPHPRGNIPYPPPISSSGNFLVDFSFPGNLSAAPPPAPIPGSAHAVASTAAETTNENMQDYMMLSQQNPAVLPTYSFQNVASVAGPSSSMPGAAAALQSEQLAQLAHPQIYDLQNDYQLNSGLSSSFQFDQVQQQQGSIVPQTSGAQENDPHTLLQAALQLAASLLQQIQRKKGN
ncbi:uncharacterized protein LOC127791726 [Diospyros lotus]|uniref:uncharacterized protein LOC127791726 n=1 Tax=Diospyros lotus TaxID=55363 RepID=UPI00225AADA4|nr:uncharacterized protein LOC127791726 [Diospyros lotus]